MPTITAELRKWRRVGEKFVKGFVYNDIKDIYDQGEEAMFQIQSWNESANFIIVHTFYGIFKLDKDEEYGKNPDRRR